MRIAGKQMEVGRDEIARHVDLSALAPGTDVRAYVLVHEGDSRPIDPDTGYERALRWGRAAVRRVAALVRAGTQFVKSHTDRAAVGEVLGSWTAEVGGRLRAIVAGAFKQQAADGMDICSIEASGVTDDSGVVTEVETVDAIALGSSRHDTARISRVRCWPARSMLLRIGLTLPRSGWELWEYGKRKSAGYHSPVRERVA